MRLTDDAQAFVDAVAEALVELSPSTVTQDQLDVFLLGGTVPPIRIPQPDPECRDCWGTGRVCSCHGFARLSRVCTAGVTEKCRCLR